MAALVLWLLCVSAAKGQGVFYQAREMAMAGAFGAVAVGADASSWNPANLGLVLNPQFTLQMPAVGLRVLNDGFSFSDYERFNGAVLTDFDKQEILNKFGEDGLKLFVNSGSGLLGLSVYRLAVSAHVDVASDLTLSRDILDLAFYGNQLGKEYDFSQTGGRAWAVADISVSYGQPLYLPFFNDFAVGVGVHWLQGLAAAEVLESQGSIQTNFEGLVGNGSAKIRTAMGGSGFALDLGAAAILPRDLRVSIGLRNVVGSINWNSEVKIYEYGVSTDTLTVEALATGDVDSLVHDFDKEYTGDAFSQTRPLELRLGVAWPFGKFLFSGQYIQHFQDAPGINTKPYVALGTEWAGLGFLPLRFGLGFGGTNGLLTAFGFGLRFGGFSINWAVQSVNQAIPGKGSGLGIGMDLNWGLRN